MMGTFFTTAALEEVLIHQHDLQEVGYNRLFCATEERKRRGKRPTGTDIMALSQKMASHGNCKRAAVVVCKKGMIERSPLLSEIVCVPSNVV